MKYNYIVKEIDKETALRMVKKYHYSNTLPRINKHFIGFYLNESLAGIVTLGWGTRPKHTIKRLFPSLNTKDYLEIGRMCMTEEMPKNSESQMLAKLVKYIKNNIPTVKILFTWADGMLGKCGYVYQASNFIYAGYSDTDIYLLNGYKIHPRQTKKLFSVDSNDTRLSVRPTAAQMSKYGIQHYRGRQYRYIYFLTDKKETKQLKQECIVSLADPMPKDKDLVWRVRDNNTGKWIPSEKPPYKSDGDVDTLISIIKAA